MKTQTRFELGREDLERGERRPAVLDPNEPAYSPGVQSDGTWDDKERAAGWDAAYRDSLEKAAGGLRRIHAGRYESEDGRWSIVKTGRAHWSLLYGIAPGLRSQAEIMAYPTFSEAMAGLRGQLAGMA